MPQSYTITETGVDSNRFYGVGAFRLECGTVVEAWVPIVVLAGCSLEHGPQGLSRDRGRKGTSKRCFKGQLRGDIMRFFDLVLKFHTESARSLGVEAQMVPLQTNSTSIDER